MLYYIIINVIKHMNNLDTENIKTSNMSSIDNAQVVIIKDIEKKDKKAKKSKKKK